MAVGSPSPEGRRLWQLYWENSVAIPGPVTEALGQAARDAGVVLAIGVTERDKDPSRGTLYCPLLYIDTLST